MYKIFSLFISAIGFIVIFSACSGSRAITNSGKVTPKGKVQIGADMTLNIPTATGTSVFELGKDFIDTYGEEDSLFVNTQVENAQKALYAYSIDPLASGYDFFIRYGFVRNFDAGYKYSSGAHKLDFQYQFLGDSCHWQGNNKNFNGSISVQFSYVSMDFSNFYLDEVSSLLGFEYTKSTLLVPVIFSQSFGEDEKIGRIAFGAVYCHTFMDYSIIPTNLYSYENVKYKAESHSVDYPSFGLFSSLKLGYKYVYLLGSLSMYYQNYGSYTLFTGQKASFKGVTIIPTIGLHFMLGKGKNKKEKTI